jgi:GTP-binding protein
MRYDKAEFKAAYGTFSQLPDTDLPEIAFAGRSNVGKSSLLNRLFGRKNLARVSSVPGKTITINFYHVDEYNFVDLPGYGYAKRGKKATEKLQNIIEHYILDREQLTCLFVLIDSRLSPQKIDLEFIEWLGEHGIPFGIIFTKADKNKAGELKKNVAEFLNTLQAQWEELPPHFITSSEKRIGRDEFLDYIDQINQSL